MRTESQSSPSDREETTANVPEEQHRVSGSSSVYSVLPGMEWGTCDE
jgi:hypothetical protein